MKLIIERELAQKVLTYLSRQPFNEVVNFIQPLMQLKPLKEPAAPKAPAKE